MSFLRERNLLVDVSTSRISVTEIVRRNLNLAVAVDGQPAWFVKQLRHGSPETIRSQRREAQCYQIVQDTPSLSALCELMPRCVFYDAEASILVLEALDGVNAADAHVQVGSFNDHVAEMLGARLAELHATTAEAVQSGLRALLPGDLPWVLRPPGSVPAGQQMAFVAHIVDDRAFAWEIAAARDLWSRHTLIHGDARLENFLFCRPVDQQPECQIRVVDWELTDFGDWAWDCAGVMQHYWQEWLQTGPESSVKWDALQNVIEHFWKAYAAGRGEDTRLDGPAFRRATRLTGVRLVQTSYEHLACTGRWTPTAEYCARTARLLLTDTDSALNGFKVAHHGA